jgi:hypothetical protein
MPAMSKPRGRLNITGKTRGIKLAPEKAGRLADLAQFTDHAGYAVAG